MTPAYGQARSLLEVGRDEQAEATLRAALTDTPDDPRLLLLLAFTLRRRREYPAAVQAAEAALALDPADPDAHVERAEGLLSLLRAKDAVQAGEQAVHIAPDDPAGHLVRARALAALRRFPEAREAAGRGLALAPRSVHALLTAADVERDAGHRAEAERYARAGLAINPDDGYGRWLLAMLDAERLQVRRSLRTLSDVARDNPARPDVLSMTWPLRSLLTALRRWFSAALVVVLVAAVVAVRWEVVTLPAQVFAALAGSVVLGFGGRVWVPAGRVPWRALRLVPRLLRRAVLAGVVTVGVQLALVLAYAVTGAWWLTVIAVGAVPVLCALGLVEAIGARIEDPGYRYAIADVARGLREFRAELAQWWRDTRRELREAWREDQPRR
ncbi:tetratricopeptide repeat protein [Symbioplanes lichenis]|uniref:tetratricopeptide repeat protein n=1 Tax=Symbioplanes lichenis TaxID=1629072 RepID=UPI002738BB38|nr:tetratricopeptide repeat protein [Actinoplanes lichenis]